jgi:hypothetical protein
VGYYNFVFAVKKQSTDREWRAVADALCSYAWDRGFTVAQATRWIQASYDAFKETQNGPKV